MNNLQKYLLKEAINAINHAGGNLVRDGELDLKTISASMDELLTYIKDAEVKVESKIKFPLSIMTYEARKGDLETFNRKPLFVKPRKEPAK